MTTPDAFLTGLANRIEKRRAALSLSDREASIKATGKPDLIRDIKRGVMPTAMKVAQLAPVLRCRLEWLMTGSGPEDDGIPDSAGDEARKLLQLFSTLDQSGASLARQILERLSGLDSQS